MRVSIAELGEMPHERFMDFARLCELLRYDGFYHADEKWTRDLWARLGMAAAVTSRIKLGPSVTDPVTRHPALMAQAAATLAEATQGRFQLMIGAGSHFETLPGYDVSRPAVHIREAIELCRQMWTGERVTYEGEMVQFLGGKLDFALNPEYTPKIWVASRGVQVLRMAGATADGVLVGSFATDWGINYAKTEIEKGLDRSGRTWDDITLASWLYVCILPNEDDPVPEGIRRGVSHALWSSRPIMEPLIEALAGDVPDDFRNFVRDAPHEWSPEVLGELRRLIPRSLIDQMSVVGTAEQVTQKLLNLERLGVQEIVVWPFPHDAGVVTTANTSDVEDFVVDFAQNVMPRVRRHESRGEYTLVD